MFEKFLSVNLESFRQRYEGTYGFFRDDRKRRTLVRLESINNSRCEFVDEDSLDYHLNIDTDEDMGFEFIPPEAKWYNTPNFGAVYTERIVQRQFSRGVTDSNLSIMVLNKGRLTPKMVGFDILSQIYEHAIDPKMLVERWKDGDPFAISGQFALDQGRVYLFKEPAGEYRRKDKHLSFKMNEPELWKTELADACRNIGFTSEVS